MSVLPSISTEIIFKNVVTLNFFRRSGTWVIYHVWSPHLWEVLTILEPYEVNFSVVFEIMSLSSIFSCEYYVDFYVSLSISPCASMSKWLLFMSPKAGRSHWTDWEIIFTVYYPHALSITFYGQDVETFFCISSLKAQILLVLYSYYHWCNCSFQPLCYQVRFSFHPLELHSR